MKITHPNYITDDGNAANGKNSLALAEVEVFGLYLWGHNSFEVCTCDATFEKIYIWNWIKSV